MLKLTGTVISLPASSGGGGGKGCARCTSASVSASSAAEPELATMRLDNEMALRVDAEGKPRHAVLAARARFRGVALVAFQDA